MRKTALRRPSARLRLAFRVLATVDLLLGVTVLVLLLAQPWIGGGQNLPSATSGVIDPPPPQHYSGAQAPSQPADNTRSSGPTPTPDKIALIPSPTSPPHPTVSPTPTPSPSPSPLPTPKPSPTAATRVATKPASASQPTPPGPTELPQYVRNFRQDGQKWTCEAYGNEIGGVLIKPEGAGPFPALIVSHGTGADAQTFCRNRLSQFPSTGYVVIAVNYTHANMKSDRTLFGASTENVNRARAVAAIVHALPYVDQKRVYAYGHNLGAFVTLALAAEMPPDKLTAIAVTSGGVASSPGTPMPTEDLCRHISCPVLILHAGADRTILPARSQALQDLLNARQVPNARKVFDRPDIFGGDSKEVFQLIGEWFTKYKTPQPPRATPATLSGSRPASRPVTSSAPGSQATRPR